MEGRGVIRYAVTGHLSLQEINVLEDAKGGRTTCDLAILR